MIRTIFFYPCLIISLIIVSLARIKIKILQNKGDKQKTTAYIHKVTSSWARFALKLAGAKVKVTGMENIPNDKTVLFVSNHQSNFDIPLLMGYIDVPKGFIAKKELNKWPFISTWMKYINCVFMDRHNLRQSAESIVQGINILKSGYSMVVFPEGTRSKGKPVDEFKAGSFKLSIKSKCPIVPITINGTYKLLEQNNNKIKAADIELIIHPPVDVTKLNKDELDKLPENVHSIITSKYKNS